jgi:hypothetical protein
MRRTEPKLRGRVERILMEVQRLKAPRGNNRRRGSVQRLVCG